MQTAFPVGMACVQLVSEIVAAAERVVANHARCARLVERVRAMLPFLQQLRWAAFVYLCWR